MFRATNVPNYQNSKLPMFRATNIPSCHATSAPRTKEREPKCKNQSARTEVREPKNKIFGAKSLEQSPWSKKPLFSAFLAVKLTRNPTFGISFCFAVKGKQVVLLLVHGFAALTKVFCRLLLHRSGQKPLFAEGKIVSEEHVDQVILVRLSSGFGCYQPKYPNTTISKIQKTKNISPYDYR